MSVKIINDIQLPQTNFVHVRNNSKMPIPFVHDSKHYEIAAESTELMNYFMYIHVAKLFEAGKCPLVILDEKEGSVEYVKAKAKQAEIEAREKIEAANKAVAEAEEAKKALAEVRIRQQTLEGDQKKKKDN